MALLSLLQQGADEGSMLGQHPFVGERSELQQAQDADERSAIEVLLLAPIAPRDLEGGAVAGVTEPVDRGLEQ